MYFCSPCMCLLQPNLYEGDPSVKDRLYKANSLDEIMQILAQNGALPEVCDSVWTCHINTIIRAQIVCSVMYMAPESVRPSDSGRLRS